MSACQHVTDCVNIPWDTFFYEKCDTCDGETWAGVLSGDTWSHTSHKHLLSWSVVTTPSVSPHHGRVGAWQISCQYKVQDTPDFAWGINLVPERLLLHAGKDWHLMGASNVRSALLVSDGDHSSNWDWDNSLLIFSPSPVLSIISGTSQWVRSYLHIRAGQTLHSCFICQWSHYIYKWVLPSQTLNLSWSQLTIHWLIIFFIHLTNWMDIFQQIAPFSIYPFNGYFLIKKNYSGHT